MFLTLVNNVTVALRNANAFQNIQCLNEDLKKNRDQLTAALTELDRRVYHLKTLNDVSKDIFGVIEFEHALKNFLFMTLGNFGVMEGFIATLDSLKREILHFFQIGFGDDELSLIQSRLRECSSDCKSEDLIFKDEKLSTVIPFRIDETFHGFLGLGYKITGEEYGENDRELIDTLVNNLVIALRNVRSFEEIKDLNEDLQSKNVLLEKTLAELQAALKKVEILENIKANLSKFVPAEVRRIIEKSKTASLPEAKEQDVSVLFLDIEGYTRISERLQATELNELIERYFSVFMDAIYANNGDVNETAGDGLMVLFLNENKIESAAEAVQTALSIREKTILINRERGASAESLLINMGINSGRALLGAAKFDSLTGSRWTYTARGSVTNIAARIGAMATAGAIFISRSTADRIKGKFSITPMGKFRLKNVSREVEIFSV